jgi:hypothetical protein
MKDTLNIALKEWAVTVRALRENRQIILLRKGGIMEAVGGFQTEHDEFLLFPTYLHQNEKMLKSDVHPWYEPATVEPEKILIDTACEVTDIIRLKARTQMNTIDEFHVWTDPLIDMRFNYKPQNPLYLLIARAYRLQEPVTIDNTPAYAGCKSWVPLTDSISTQGAVPVMSDAVFNATREKIIAGLDASG